MSAMMEQSDLKAPRLLTVQQAATILGCAPNTVYQMLKDGDLRGIRIRTAWRISVTEIQRFLDSGGSPNGGVGD